MSEHSNPRKQRRWWKILLAVLIAFGLAYGFYRYDLRRKVEQRLEAIREQGVPVTLADLAEWLPQVEPSSNGAPVVQAAFSNYVRPRIVWIESERNKEDPRIKLLPGVGRADLPPRTERLAEDMMEAIESFLKENETAMSLLHEGAAFEVVQFPLELEKGIDAAVPRHAEPLRHGVRLLQLEALFNAERGDPEKAVQAVVSAASLTRSVSTEPLIVSHLLRVACASIVCTSLEQVLNRTQLTDAQLMEIANSLENLEDLQGIERLALGNRCFDFEMFQRIPRFSAEQFTVARLLTGENFLFSRATHFLYIHGGLLELDWLTYNAMMDEYLLAAQLPWPERLDRVSLIKGKIDALPIYKAVSRIVLPALPVTALRDAMITATIRTSMTACAVERYRLANRALPHKLEQLVPVEIDAVPMDPMDGEPLRFKRLPVGYMIYSVGADRTNHGGVEKDARGRRLTEGTDITFTVERE